MRFPLVRERVRVEGRDGTYLVLALDRARGVAAVISSRGGQVQESVPLESILPLTSGKERKPKKETPEPPKRS